MNQINKCLKRGQEWLAKRGRKGGQKYCMLEAMKEPVQGQDPLEMPCGCGIGSEMKESSIIDDDPIVAVYKRYSNWIHGRIDDATSPVVVKDVCQAIVEHCRRKGIV